MSASSHTARSARSRGTEAPRPSALWASSGHVDDAPLPTPTASRSAWPLTCSPTSTRSSPRCSGCWRSCSSRGPRSARATCTRSCASRGCCTASSRAAARHRGDALGAAGARRRAARDPRRSRSRSRGCRCSWTRPTRALAAERSAQLRGLLEELRREHACNRALMQIELSFLDHLMQSLALDAGVHGYDPRGSTTGQCGAPLATARCACSTSRRRQGGPRCRSPPFRDCRPPSRACSPSRRRSTSPGQHHQRQHRRVLAPDGRPADQRTAAHRRALRRHRRGRRSSAPGSPSPRSRASATPTSTPQYRDQSTAARRRVRAGRRAPAGARARSTNPPPPGSPPSSRRSGAPGANSPTRPPNREPRRLAVVCAATQLTGTLHQLAAQLQSLEGQAAAQYAAITGPSGEVASRRGADRPTQPPDQALPAGAPAAQRTRRPPRPAGRQALRAGLRQRHQGSRRHRHRHLRQRRAAARGRLHGQLAPGAHRRRRAGSSGRCWNSRAPPARSPPTRPALDEVAATLASSVNELHTATPFFKGATAATLEVAVTPAEVQTSSEGASGGNNVALAIAGLRGGAADQRYAALVAQVGAGRAERTSRPDQPRRRSSPPSPTSARPSPASRSMKK